MPNARSAGLPCGWRLALMAGCTALGTASQPARAADGADPVPMVAVAPAGAQADGDAVTDSHSDTFSNSAAAAGARASQPSWSSPLVTTTGLLEQRLRFDIDEQHSGNGTSTTQIDGGKGVDLIVSDTNEIQIAAPPYDIRTSSLRTGKGALTGFADWPVLRVEQRLASSPAGEGDYVLTAFVAVQAPSGIEKLTSNAYIWTPTIAFGKGWGDFDIQGTFGAALPGSHADTIGYQIQTNLALQYHVLEVLWPQLEANWTHYADGQREGLNQVYLTPGLVIGRFALGDNVKFTCGAGYQFAVAPSYHASPLTPAYNHAWIFTSRFNF